MLICPIYFWCFLISFSCSFLGGGTGCRANGSEDESFIGGDFRFLIAFLCYFSALGERRGQGSPEPVGVIRLADGRYAGRSCHHFEVDVLSVQS